MWTFERILAKDFVVSLLPWAEGDVQQISTSLKHAPFRFPVLFNIYCPGVTVSSFCDFVAFVSCSIPFLRAYSLVDDILSFSPNRFIQSVP